MRRTKIIATLGPAVAEESKMRAIIKAGCDIARLNIAHGTIEEHKRMKRRFERISMGEEKNTAVMLDIKGPEIRTTKCRKKFAKNGETITIGKGEDIEFNQEIVYDYLEPETTLLIHDGEVVIKIKDKSGNLATGEVIQGGIIAPHMGVNVPSVSIPIPYLQDRDVEFLKELKDVDFVAASFTRSASDIIQLRELMEDLDMDSLIIAKIENREGIKNIDEILEISDGIMVARGDLGTEIPVEKLPETQKFLLRKSQEYGKPGIIATQILESMIRNPQPTRAEVSDIANAIIDGADALMLSGETAIGKYPVEAVKILAKVAEEADMMVEGNGLLELKGSLSESVSNAAVLLAGEINANAILALTRTGKTARLISRHRPKMPILAATYSESTLHSCTLYWGVEAFKVRKFKYTENAVKTAIKRAESLNLVKKGNAIVVVGGEPSGTLGSTNFLWVQIVGEVIARGKGYGNKIVNGKMCRWPELCDIVVMEKLEKIEKARGIVIESKIYEPTKLERLAGEDISILASTGKIKIEKGSVTLDPKRGILLK